MSKKKTLRVFAAKCFDSICVKAFVPFFRRLFRQTLFAPIAISERSEQFSVNSRAVNMNPVLGNPSNR